MILNILNNPIRLLGSFAIKALMKTFGVPTITFPFFSVLYQTATTLSRTVGVVSTLRVVWHIGRHLNSSFSTMRSLLSMNSTLNQFVLQTILNAIQPFWNLAFFKDIKFIRFFSFWYKLLALCCGMSIIRFFLRILTTIILASVGIMWNETLFNVVYLKKFALFVTDLLNHYLNFSIPLPNFAKVKSNFTAIKDTVSSWFGTK